MTPNQGSSYRMQVGLGFLVALILTGLSLVTVGAMSGGVNVGGYDRASCKVPNLSGTVVRVTLTDMGGSMMGQSTYMMFPGTMRLSADRATVPQGTVSFRVSNYGGIAHEMVILPLLESQSVGARSVRGDGKIDEAGSLGEASTTCGEGSGNWIAPGASSWVSVTLPPGRYELVCNLPGHYAAGMYTQLTVI